MYDPVVRLRGELLAFAVDYPDAWKSEADPSLRPLEILVHEFAEEIRGDPAMWIVARQLGAELREKHHYVTRESSDEASADYLRGIAHFCAEVMHGGECSDFGGGDKFTSDHIAFYIADDWWLGRDGIPEAEWADIRRVREQMMLDLAGVPSTERPDTLAFAASFIKQHPALVCEAEWALEGIGSGEGFPAEVWAATGKDEVWRGVYFFAEQILAGLPNSPSVQ